MNKDATSDYLKAVVKHGNISNAARALFISQPYLSRVIKKLEDDLGVNLINRDQTPLTLTYAGERYLAHMEKIDKAYLDLKHEVESIANMKKGRLRLGINPILGMQLLHRLIPDFTSTYPGIEIELLEGSARGVGLLLEQRKVDIALTLLPPSVPSDSELTYEKLYEEDMCLVVPEGHKYYDREVKEIVPLPFDFLKLNGEKFILVSPTLGIGQTMDHILKHYSVTPDVLLETTNIENAYRVANSGIALTIVPECIKHSNLPTKSNFYTIGNPAFKITYVIAYRKGESLTVPALSLLNMAVENYRVTS